MVTKAKVVTANDDLRFESNVNYALDSIRTAGCEVVSVQYQMTAQAKYGNAETMVYSALITYREPKN